MALFFYISNLKCSSPSPAAVAQADKADHNVGFCQEGLRPGIQSWAESFLCLTCCSCPQYDSKPTGEQTLLLPHLEDVETRKAPMAFADDGCVGFPSDGL